MFVKMKSNSEIFHIYFDLDWENNHSLSIDNSIVTEESIRTIVFELNRIIFDNQLNISLDILPPSSWSYIKNFSIIWVVTFIAWSMFSDVTNWISKWLTWYEVKEHIEHVTIVMKDMVIGFLNKKNYDLVQSWIDYDWFYKMYDAKNKFYQEWLKNRKINAIWFMPNWRGKIPRDEFWYRIVDLKAKVSQISPIEKFHKLKVVSSINTREDKDLVRHVKDVISRSKRFTAYMSDQNFYDFYLNKPFFIDSLVVKMLYTVDRDENWELEIKKKEIITVYEYNEILFQSLPEYTIIEKAPYKLNPENEDIINNNIQIAQPWLFDWLI